MITWFAEARCDANDYDVAGSCEAKTEVTLTLKAERVIDVEVPDGWTLRYRVCDDSGSDVNGVDLAGGTARIFCPKHKTESY